MKKTNVLSARKVAQVKELVKELCTLLGGRFVIEGSCTDAIRGNERRKTGIQCRTTAKKEALPERAWELLEKARDGGLLDENLQPLVSRRRAALLAQIISREVFGANRWKAFEELWSVRGLQQDYQKSQYLNTFDSDKSAYERLLCIKVRP